MERNSSIYTTFENGSRMVGMVLSCQCKWGINYHLFQASAYTIGSLVLAENSELARGQQRFSKGTEMKS